MYPSQMIKELIKLSKEGQVPGFHHLHLNGDGVLEIIHPPSPSQFTFTYKSERYYLALSALDDGHSHLSLWGVIGQLPYSAQAPELRLSLLKILQASGALQSAKLVITPHQEVLLLAQDVVRQGALNPEDILYPVVLALYEASPYIEVLRNYGLQNNRPNAKEGPPSQ
jgi:hypothetical protein